MLGYFIYGTFVEKVFGIDPNRTTPCYTKQDGTDYIPMPTWKVYTVQFLNIAGTGPIFGAMMGVLYGPAAFLWIVFGCILGGAMHDYMAGMISIRRGGMGLPEIIGDELGSVCRLVMRVVTLVLMICVGASFVLIPAGLMDQLTLRLFDVADTNLIWTVLILVFYLAVTVFSINKVIGTIYPVFGAALLIMAVLIGFGIFTHEGNIPSIMDSFTDHYPVSYTPLFPGLFITIACGAVSGFHATQSPMMARCIKNEKYGLRCFYGAMVTEGVVALIWAAAAMKFVDMMDVAGATPYEKLYNAMTACGTVKMNPGLLVERMCNDWLGNAGLVLAVLGIVAAPMSTGGSAFRAARMIVADFSHYDQKPLAKRLILTAPLFAVAIAVALCLMVQSGLGDLHILHHRTFPAPQDRRQGHPAALLVAHRLHPRCVHVCRECLLHLDRQGERLRPRPNDRLHHRRNHHLNCLYWHVLADLQSFWRICNPPAQRV